MVVIGGITRLTESGLSITEWEPISGAIPPLTHADWVRAFELYQADSAISGGRRSGRNDPVRLQVHLLLGVGPSPARPAARPRLLRRRRLVRGEAADPAAAMAGGSRRCSSWAACRARSAGSWSCPGSRDGPRSAPIACRPICCSPCSCSSALIWTALDLRAVAAIPAPGAADRLGPLALATLFIQLMLGAWVAGFRAGYVSNSWPLMNGRFVPDGIDWSHGPHSP